MWKQSKCPSTGEWIKKMYTHTHTHTHTGILNSHKKNEILLFAATWMDLENIMLKSKVCQAEKDKYHKISLICGI